MSDRRVGLVYSSREWRRPFQQHVRNHVAGIRVILVRDERTALEEPLDVLIVDDETSFLSADVVEVLRARGVRLLGVYDPNDPGGPRRLSQLGIDVTVRTDSAPAEFLAALEQVDSRIALDFERITAHYDDDEPPVEVGSVIAVGGPATAGKTEVAVALAELLSRAGRTLLLDAADVYPSVARRLHLGLHPHLLVALDEARSAPMSQVGGLPLINSLAQPAAGADELGLPFDVVCGLANPSDWQVVRPDDLQALLRRVCGPWRYVVCDTGPHLEDLVRLDRWPLSRASIGSADRLVGVCPSNPDGLLRFLDWLVEAASLAPLAVEVVVNRAPRSLHQRSELEDQLRENGGGRVASVTFAPDDPRVGRAAWDGHTAGRSRFAKTLEPVVAALQAPAMSVSF